MRPSARSIPAISLLLFLVGESCAAHVPPMMDDYGFLVHELHSARQAGPTKIRVLLPQVLIPQKRYPVVFLLPVEANDEQRYGDGLLEAKRRDLANKHQVLFVAPAFTALPWYADHPTDPHLHQEGYFLSDVVPFVERTYPVLDVPTGRWLVGFSKSGWGAYSLVLRHLDHFAGAAVWDAPLMMDRPGPYGSGPIFGSDETFAEYRITDLLRRHKGRLNGKPRLVLTGYGGFRQQHEQVHDLMLKLRIEHIYRDGPERKHEWHSGWLAEAVELLLSPND